MFKSTLALLLSLTLLFGLAACNSRQQETLSNPVDNILLESVSSPEEEKETSSPSSAAESVAESREVPAESVVISREMLLPVSSEESVPITESIISSETAGETSRGGEEAVSESLSEVSSAMETSSYESHFCIPVYDFSQQTAEELLAWMEQEKKRPLTQRSHFVDEALLQGKMPVPRSVRDDLSSYLVQIWQNSDTCSYSFRADGAESDSGESYRIAVSPDPYDGADLLSSIRYQKSELKSGNYNNLDFVYVDGRNTDDPSDRFVTCAWFVQDGYLIRISQLGDNAYEPWSTDCFDYFEFETVTF